MSRVRERYYWWSGWTAASAVLLLLVATPIITILVKLFGPTGQSFHHIVETQLLDYFVNSSIILVGVAFFTALIGISCAWLVTSFEFPFRKQLEWMLILPLSFPGYIMAYTYVGLVEYTSPIHTWMRHSLGINISGSLVELMNLPGVIFILSITLYPYVYLLVRASFIQQSRTFQEAAAILGSSKWTTFIKIALPMARPAIAAGIALASMEVLNDYGTVKYYGVNTFTTGIFRAWFSMGDATSAIYLAGILMVFVLLLIYLENLQRGQRKFGQSNAMLKPFERASTPTLNRWLMTFFCGSILLVSFLLPLGQLLYWVSITYHKVINWEFVLLIFRTFGLAISCGFFVVVISVALLYALRLSPFFWQKYIVSIATLGYAIPGAVIAVGIMIPLLQLDKAILASIPGISGLLFSGTLFALMFAYIVRFLAVGYNPLEAGFQKIGIHVNEAGRMLGTNSLITLFKIDLPLLKASVITGMLLVFVDVQKELPLTLILRPFNFHTLATKAFDMATNEMIAESANAALIIIATGIIPIIFLNQILTRKANSQG